MGHGTVLEGLSDALLSAADAAGLGVGVTEIVGDQVHNVFLSDRAVAILGWSREQLATRNALDNVAPEARAELLAHLGKAEQDVDGRTFETVVVRADGARVPISSSISQIELGGRKVTVSFFYDVSEREQALRALAESEARFRTLVEAANDAVVMTRRGSISYANEAAERCLGYGKGELLGLDWSRILPPEELAAMGQRITEMIREGTVLPPREYRGRRANGEEVVIEIASRVLMDRGEPLVLGFGRDLTERRRLEAQIAHADRLTALGTMAAGVAHEINNPLAYLSLSAEALDEQIREAPLPAADRASLLELLDRVREGADRVAAIVRDMRLFTRGEDDVQPKPVDVCAIVEAAVRLVGHDLRGRARLVRTLEPAWALGTPGRLEQVVVNLLVNAAQALRPDAVEPEIHVRVRQTAEGVVVEVEDDGVGIPAATLPRVFDPFFTTKAPGVGTGLGLSVCHSLVHQMGGTIGLSSTEGKGTIARVVLRAASAPASASVRAAPRERSRGLRVLVVDDEHLIGSSITALLEDDHAVTFALGGERGLAHALDGDFDVILCDLTMPVVSGMDLHSRVREARPELAARFVFMTGGATTERARQFLAEVENPTLEKPFRAATLEQVLASVNQRV
ncbi:MAG: PAS domain S-box protein [Myxococcales bacterium]|nr:PAS domain S-box protein [Myxococcales bacterium]